MSPHDPKDTHPSFRPEDLPRNGNGNGHESESPFADVPTAILIGDIARTVELTAEKVDGLLDDSRAHRIGLDRIEGQVRGLRSEVTTLHAGTFEAVAIAKRTELLVEKVAARVGVVDSKAEQANRTASLAAREASRSSWTDEVAKEAATAGIRGAERQREAALKVRSKAWSTANSVGKYLGMGLAGVVLTYLTMLAKGCHP